MRNMRPKKEVAETTTVNSVAEKVQSFVDEVQKRRNIKVMMADDELELYVDDIKAMHAKVLKHCIHAEMLPDIYTYSNWANKIVVGTIHYNGRGDMCINFDAEEIDLGDLLNIVKDAVIELNLYGYTYE